MVLEFSRVKKSISFDGVQEKKTSLLSPDHKAIDSTSLSNFYREIVRGIFLFVFFLFAWVCIRDLTDLEEDLVAIQI